MNNGSARTDLSWPLVGRQRQIAVLVLLTIAIPATAQLETGAFPLRQPDRANFNRPINGQHLDTSPPGFCWWRAGRRDAVFYRLSIRNSDQKQVHRSPRLRDPVYVPPVVLPAGRYTWIVEAHDARGDVVAERPAATFVIDPEAIALPWLEPAELLARVKPEHPRLLFPRAKLDEVRRSLNSSRKRAFDELRAIADRALQLAPMAEPDFDRFDVLTQYAERRTAYREAYSQFTRIYHGGALPMALVYLLTGEQRYGEAAKTHLLAVLDWDTEGVASLEEGFDEIGLRIARILPQCYDWLYDLLTEEERRRVQVAVRVHGNALLSRLQQKDFLHLSAFSHDGRLPGYLIEFAIALAEDPAARRWMDYGLRALRTVFPHWAGEDGGWAEGVSYALSYNERFITPLASLEAATGHDLWQMPYFRKMRRFLVYCTAPEGEIMPFGDGEAHPVRGRLDRLHSILQFHALKFSDAGTRAWIDLLPAPTRTSRTGPLHRLILPDELEPSLPPDWNPDAAFRGVGWAALHSNVFQPDDDLMVLFKSSPFGAVSHSHGDQNSFIVMKGGRALTISAGQRYPQHFSPFHTEYTWQTAAHNALLINGKGQILRDGQAGGQIVDFRTSAAFGYVCGDASACYSEPLQRYWRHLVLIRPSLLLVVDEVDGREPLSVDWLLHGKEKFDLHESEQTLVARRDNHRLSVYLLTPGGFDFTQTNEWPVPPRQGYPMVTAPEPDPQWHFGASLRDATRTVRIAAVMVTHGHDELPQVNLSRRDAGEVELVASDGAVIKIRLNLAATGQDPVATVAYRSAEGHVESLALKK